MKNALVVLSVISMVLMFLFGLEVIQPAWVFDDWFFRVAIFFVAFAVACYHADLWPSNSLNNEKD